MYIVHFWALYNLLFYPFPLVVQIVSTCGGFQLGYRNRHNLETNTAFTKTRIKLNKLISTKTKLELRHKLDRQTDRHMHNYSHCTAYADYSFANLRHEKNF